jgi:hypothetical protein
MEVLNILGVVGFVLASLAVGLFWPVREVLRRRRTHRELPALAARLGLRHIPSNVIDVVGEFVGVIRGYAVRLLPDDGRIQVSARSPLALDLAEATPHLKPEEGFVAVETCSRLFNKRLCKRYVGVGLVRHFERPSPLLDSIVAYLRRYKRFRSPFLEGHFRIGGALLEDCPFEQRSPSWLPIAGLEKRLEALIEIARAMDEVSKEGGHPALPRCDPPPGFFD